MHEIHLRWLDYPVKDLIGERLYFWNCGETALEMYGVELSASMTSPMQKSMNWMGGWIISLPSSQNSMSDASKRENGPSKPAWLLGHALFPKEHRKYLYKISRLSC